jgi:hypothetical protein
MRGRRRNKPWLHPGIEFHAGGGWVESSSWGWRNELLLLHRSEDFGFLLRYYVTKFRVEGVLVRQNVLEQLRSALAVTDDYSPPSGDYTMDNFLKQPGLLGLELGLPQIGEMTRDRFTDETEARKLSRCLKKIGLCFHSGNLAYADPERKRWDQVSMWARSDTGMPTTVEHN